MCNNEVRSAPERAILLLPLSGKVKKSIRSTASGRAIKVTKVSCWILWGCAAYSIIFKIISGADFDKWIIESLAYGAGLAFIHHVRHYQTILTEIDRALTTMPDKGRSDLL